MHCSARELELKFSGLLTQPTHGLNKFIDAGDSRYKEALRQGTKAYDQSPAQWFGKDDFSQFKAEFEAKHPEQAKAIEEHLRPRHERLALEAVARIHQLEKELAQSRIPGMARERLEKYASSLSKQQEVMAI